MVVGPLAGFAVPLLPAQILWINLLTHGVPGVAMGNEPADPDVLVRPPRPPHAHLLNGLMLRRVSVIAVALTVVTLLCGILGRHAGAPTQSLMFVTLAGGQLACAIALRARHLRWTSNPLLFGSVALNVGLLLLAVAWQPLRSLLHTAPLRPGDLLGAVLAALAVALVAVVTKRFSTPVATRLATRCL